MKERPLRNRPLNFEPLQPRWALAAVDSPWCYLWPKPAAELAPTELIQASTAEGEGPSTDVQALVPLYQYPWETYPTTLNAWWRDIKDTATPTQPITVLISPANGTAAEGSGDFNGYRDALRSLRTNASIRILGYVYTKSSVSPPVYRDIAEIKANIDTYERYRDAIGNSLIDGIFIDQVSNEAGVAQPAFYAEIASYVRSRTQLAGTFLVANPGAVPPAAVLSPTIADVFLTTENAGEANFNASQIPDDAGGGLQFAAVVHSVPTLTEMQRIAEQAKLRGYAFVFVTDDDDSDGNPYDEEPTYWSQLDDELQRPVILDQSAPDLAVPAVNGAVVGDVQAFSPNPNFTLSYEIVGGDPNHAFTVNSATGRVTVANAAALPSTVTTVALSIRVTNSSLLTLTDTATVTMNIRPKLGRHNFNLASDVDGNGVVDVQDIAFEVYYYPLLSGADLTTTPAGAPFVDPVPDDRVDAQDVLQVIYDFRLLG